MMPMTLHAAPDHDALQHVVRLRRGEAILLGDSLIMPTCIHIDRSNPTPTSNDVSFQKQWSADPNEYEFPRVLHAWRSQETIP
jgi:hypothetical protein